MPFKYLYLKLFVSTYVQNVKASQNNTLKVNKLVFCAFVNAFKKGIFGNSSNVIWYFLAN